MLQVLVPKTCPHQVEVEEAPHAELRCELFNKKACRVRGDAYLSCQRFSRWFWSELIALVSTNFAEGLEVALEVRE